MGTETGASGEEFYWEQRGAVIAPPFVSKSRYWNLEEESVGMKRTEVGTEFAHFWESEMTLLAFQ